MKAWLLSLLLFFIASQSLRAESDYATEVYEIPQLHVRFAFFKGAEKVSTPQGWKYQKRYSTESFGDVCLAAVGVDTTMHCAGRKNFVDLRKHVEDQIKVPVEDEFYDPLLGYYSATYSGRSWYRPTIVFFHVVALKNATLTFQFEMKEYVLKEVDPKDIFYSVSFTDEWKKFPNAKLEVPIKGGLVVLQSPEQPQIFKVTTCSDYFEKKKLAVIFEVANYADKTALPQQFEAYYKSITGCKWANQYGYDRLLSLSKAFQHYAPESVMYEYLIKSEPKNPKSYEEIFVREIFAIRDDGKIIKITAYFPMEYGWENRSDSEASLIGKFDKYIFETIIHRMKLL